MRTPFIIPLVILVGLLLTTGWGRHQRVDAKVNVFTPIQSQMRERYAAEQIEDDELATLEALTLGYREDLSRSLRRHFQSAGAMHILAVSGMHTGILFSILLTILTLGGRRKPLYEDKVGNILLTLTLLLILWIYAGITGFAPSVLRSVIMLTVYQLASLAHRHAWSLNTLYVSAFIILLIRPADLYSLGFWLSFVAVWGLMSIPALLDIVHTPHSNLCEKGARMVVSLLSMSVVAQIATLPLCLYSFGQFSCYFLLTNLIVVPLATIILWVAVLFFALGWLPLTGFLLARLLTNLTHLLNSSVAWIESLPGSVFESRISFATMLSLYAMMIVSIAIYKYILLYFHNSQHEK